VSAIASYEYWSRVSLDKLIATQRIYSALHAQMRRASTPDVVAKLRREVDAADMAMNEAHRVWIETVRGK